ncbi:SdiA-regulated domain-containing protein [Methylotenera sp.]|uniref:SdiA-regulated domain-containing protein n=1 Tax=Methylotenera sp. TaxID=2051956 RepID=UPI00272FCE6C|nr:SdiA-regulated domain-containing protein [Methylotenera sp.]MDP2071303.1 SdiA-regulated domain-containing protein [Methylotenera sp.]MDP3005220.1 SdiA-regulated domain-containing protein [Methylotenera sp.]MDP3818122.1 SdiA-regulated domain-containing protein [Methylotenera sp.]
MKITSLIVVVASVFSLNAHAANLLNLGNYQVTGTYALDRLNGISGGISGLEASAVTYARDRNSLFYVGDEGTGVVEISLTGQTLGFMNFDWTGTGSTKHDTEGLTYLGGGKLVVSEERLYDAYSFDYLSGGTAALANSSVSISNATVGNSGIEGISYDSRNGGYVTVKQDSPLDILAGTLTFGSNLSGVANMTQLFNPSLTGLSSFSDVQTLSSVDALVGTPGENNLLLLSLSSRKLIEVNRSGTILSSFDLANVLPGNGIEGVTVDQHGNIYLVAEQVQEVFAIGVPVALQKSQLIVLSAIPAVPEPETYAMFLVGFGLLGFMSRNGRKSKSYK